MSLLSRLARFNQRHPWSHNDHYGRWVAGQVAASGARHVLDVGCGTGNLVALLRRRAVTVTGLEPDSATARAAVERFADDGAVTIIQTDFAGRDPQRRPRSGTSGRVRRSWPATPP
ncbi:class I SAM-dependent methyltransferase [Nonomuraea jiangxiensis]|uniref:class I SAM-dependent methyltransferase n=1 Tax=Nonomuraea jiangxiensis TaxID=633440 RepID=UPI000B858170|nr:methyltransferase domain-containing protein [Nonomuraea jiangxiensis]